MDDLDRKVLLWFLGVFLGLLLCWGAVDWWVYK